MKRSIVYIVICFVLVLCFEYVIDYPKTSMFISYLCGMFMIISQPLPKEIQDYINKKLD